MGHRRQGGARLEWKTAAALFASGHSLAFVTRWARATDNGSKGPVLRLRCEPRADEVKHGTRTTLCLLRTLAEAWGPVGRDSGAATADAVLQKPPSRHIFSPRSPLSKWGTSHKYMESLRTLYALCPSAMVIHRTCQQFSVDIKKS